MKKQIFGSTLLSLVLTFFIFEAGSFAFGRAKPEPVEPAPQPTQTATPGTPGGSITLGDIAGAGSGCANQAFAVKTSSDRKHITIEFMSFQTALQEGRTLDRKTCNIAIPILDATVASRVMVNRVEMHGMAVLGAGVSTTAGFEAFFAGGTNQRIEQFLPAAQDSRMENLFLVQQGVGATACGEGGIFRVNASALTKQEFAASNVEASQVTMGTLEIFLDTEGCI